MNFFNFKFGYTDSIPSDGVIKIVNVADPTQVITLKDHEGPVLSLAFDPKEQYLASAGSDGCVKIWDMKNGVKLVTSLPITKVDPTVYVQPIHCSL